MVCPLNNLLEVSRTVFDAQLRIRHVNKGVVLLISASGSAGKTAQRAAGYGGSEVGSMVGNAVGPPIIGGIIGNLVGDKVGQKAVGKTGLDRAAGQVQNSRFFRCF